MAAPQNSKNPRNPMGNPIRRIPVAKPSNAIGPKPGLKPVKKGGHS